VASGPDGGAAIAWDMSAAAPIPDHEFPPFWIGPPSARKRNRSGIEVCLEVRFRSLLKFRVARGTFS